MALNDRQLILSGSLFILSSCRTSLYKKKRKDKRYRN
jgi:hypothetical protein